ncbi:PLP-dependent transferase, partial [Nadsonia fulvescens var. elongata DSM 6958]
MVYQEEFYVERWMDTYEHQVTCNIAETCCYSMSLDEIAQLSNSVVPLAQISKMRLSYGVIPGSDQLRTAVATIYNDTTPKLISDNEAHTSVTKENVVITNGATAANFLVFYGLVGPGDEVVVIDPAYQSLQSVPKMFGANINLLTLKESNNYLPDMAELAQIVEEKNPKVILVNSPHNPYGSVISTSLLQDIVNIAKTCDAYVVCDEVYRPLYHNIADGDEIPASIVNLYQKGISTSSTSKAYSLAGLRVGWVATRDASALDECMKRRDYNTISVSMIDDYFATYVLSQYKPILKYNLELCRKNLQILSDFVKSSNGALSYFPPQGGSVTMLKIRGCENTEKFCADFAEKYSCLTIPGECFNRPGQIRVGFANKTADLIHGLHILKSYMES